MTAGFLMTKEEEAEDSDGEMNEKNAFCHQKGESERNESQLALNLSEKRKRA